MRNAPMVVVLVAAAFSAGVRAQFGMLDPGSVNGWVVVPDAADLEPATSLTVEAWFFVDAAGLAGATTPTILRKNPAASSYPYALRYVPATNSVTFGVWTVTGGLVTVGSPGGVSPNAWHHAAGTYDGATTKLYVDGQLVASAPKTGALVQTTATLVLASGVNAAETWRGTLDEIRIWNVARTQAAIQATRFVRLDGGAGLIAAWHFDQGLFVDAVGGHGGAPVGGATIVPSTSPLPPAHLNAAASAPIGAALHYALLTPPFTPYYLDVTFAGSQPGTPVPAPASGTFPLNPPFLFTDYGPYLPGVFTNFVGFTDADGEATAQFDLPNVAGLIGTSLTAAFFTIDPFAPLALGSISNPATAVVVPAPPTVAGVAPSSGPSLGGTPVVVTGTNFATGAVVRFDGVAATAVVVVSPTTITCVTPPNPTGPSNVQVQVPGIGAGTANGAFTFFQPVVVSSATPANAVPGATVTLAGAAFQTGATVTVGGVPAVVTAVTATSLSFVQPSGFSCNAAVVVTMPNGLTGQIVTNPPPGVSGTLNASGPAAGGATFTIIGSNFTPLTSVAVGGAAATVVSQTPVTLTVVAPPGTPGPAAVVVTSWNCTASTSYLYL